MDELIGIEDDPFDTDAYVATANEQFVVDTPEKVEWVLLKLGQYEDAIGTVKQRSKQLLDAMGRERDRFKSRFTEQVEHWAAENRTTLFKGKTLNLLTGKLQYRAPIAHAVKITVSPDTPVDAVPAPMRTTTVHVLDHVTLAQLIADNPSIAACVRVEVEVDAKALADAALAKIESGTVGPSLQNLIDNGWVQVSPVVEKLLLIPSKRSTIME
jgi:hypothetical protein